MLDVYLVPILMEKFRGGSDFLLKNPSKLKKFSHRDGGWPQKKPLTTPLVYIYGNGADKENGDHHLYDEFMWIDYGTEK